MQQWKAATPKNLDKGQRFGVFKQTSYFSISHFSEIEFLQKELQKWSSIQRTINNSQQEEEDCVLQKTLNSDVPYLWM